MAAGSRAQAGWAGIGIAPPVGSEVRLRRDGRTGRVVAHSQGGLLCRVRVEGGRAGSTTLELPGCELLPPHQPAPELAPATADATADLPAGPGPGSVIVRVIEQASEAARSGSDGPVPAAQAAPPGLAEGSPTWTAASRPSLMSHLARLGGRGPVRQADRESRPH
jgi:hypothetical protein